MKWIKNLVIPFLVLVTALYVFYVIDKKKQAENIHNTYVYFVKVNNKGEEALFPVRRHVPKNEKTLNFALYELLKGPLFIERKRGYFTEIPVKTKLLGIKESQNKTIINLSKDFESGGGSTSMEMRLKQLKYTAISSVKNRALYLDIEGKKVEYIGGEGVEVPQPLSSK